MFTGLIEACVALRRVETRGSGLRAWVPTPPGFQARLGQSIAVSGACLTVAGAANPRNGAETSVGIAGADLVFDLSSETLARTWFGGARSGDEVNLERAMQLGDRLDGHLVAGHVDGRARIVSIEDARDGGTKMAFEVEPDLARYLIEKGSITIDGVSLTVVRPRGARFDVALIPQTLERTSLARARVGQTVNVEADMIGKWIERLARERDAGAAS